MIPLSQWLAGERSFAAGLDDVTSSLPHRLELPNELHSLQQRLDDAREEGRAEACAAFEARLEQMREEERAASAQREAELVNEWTDRYAAVLGSALETLNDDLRHAVGSAVSAVLQPFLEELAREQATKAIIALLDQEMSSIQDAVLEIRAPLHLHERLSTMLQDKGLCAGLTVSPRIELVSRTGTSRFESMAAQWIAQIKAVD